MLTWRHCQYSIQMSPRAEGEASAILSGIPKEGAKAFLLKMPVIGEDFG